ncbi:Translation initiation factor IF-2P [Spraguea lophii 42_110]|uniref:Eukaryotic translation initiation factor 5B n=1 Tax=Spraguea lophii (strain 42_110) TaxID=1358809 RepID=S7XJ48_SPRLO|nr:Translation initiation factor IF-2P [Spraguea lophii 42_110]
MDEKNGAGQTTDTKSQKKPKFVRKKKQKGNKQQDVVQKKDVISVPTEKEVVIENKEESTNEIKKEEKKEKETEKIEPVKQGGRRRGPNIAMIKKLAEQKQKQEEELKKLKKQQEEEDLERIRKIEEEKKLAIEKQKKEKEERELENKMKKMKLRNFLVREKVKTVKKIEKIEEEIETDLKSPICCILGHVDTGKTKLLDKLRETDVQGSEAGGITQQIGATFFPVKELKRKFNVPENNLPGILIIDTPGHETFSNLRSRGSSLCDIAILVVDILHLLENQTLESIELLKRRKTPFIIALNKIDRIYGWKSTNFAGFTESFEKQTDVTKEEFKRQMNDTIVKFSEIGLNTTLFSENNNEKQFVSIVPTSAITGEGIPDLISTILKLSESFMSTKMKYKDEVQCTILEVKEIDGYGSTIDVILSNGILRKGDKIAVCGFDGPIITNIKSLLVPKALKEIRVKGEYMQKSEVKASLGVKIAALNLENAVAGSRIVIVKNNEEEAKKEVMQDLQNVISKVKTEEIGVHLQSSTLGSLEALVEFVTSSNIPIATVGVGKLNKKDIVRASIMAEKSIEYSPLLCFDIKIDKEISEIAEKYNIKIFCEKIVYNLLDKYKEYSANLRNKMKDAAKSSTIFPCELEILPNCVFNKRSPLVLGVEVKRGILKIGTVLCIIRKNVLGLGTVTSIENNKKATEKAVVGDKVAIKIEIGSNETPRLFGRHFVQEDLLYSWINRKSIDSLKKNFKEELCDDDWMLVIELKNKLDII